MRGQDQGRKPLVKVSCTRPHFTRQPREGEKKEREREGGGEEMGRGGKKTKQSSTKGDVAKSRLRSGLRCLRLGPVELLGCCKCLLAKA